MSKRLYYMSLAFFYIFVFLKQFYFLPSGSIGYGDLFLAVSGIILLFDMLFKKKKNILYKIDISWYCFIVAICFINGFYYYYTENREFLLFSLYWLYVTMAIWTFRTLVSECFLSGLSIVCQINLSVQTIIYITGQGRYFHENWGGSRFMGTFNDPNQFAFFIFTMLLTLYLIYLKNKKKYILVFLIDALFLIGLSKSTGVFTGVFTLGLFIGGLLIWQNFQKSNFKIVWIICLSVGVILAGIGLYCIWPNADFNITLTDYTLFSRIQQKIWKFSHGNIADLLYDRSAERLILYPEYLIYGSGEGMFERFLPGDYVNQITPGVLDVVRVNEIHSSLFAVWFSYGIIPLLMLCHWIKKNISCCNRWQLIVVIALAVESFSLMNCRQPFFWFIIVFASCYGMEKKIS